VAKYVCYICGHEGNNITHNYDHRVPLSKGGADDFRNISDACDKCNEQKGNRTVQEYRKWLNDNPEKIKENCYPDGDRSHFAKGGTWY